MRMLLIVSTIAAGAAFHPAPAGAHEEDAGGAGPGNEQHAFSHALYTGIGVPLNGTLYLAWGQPVSERLMMASYIAFFQRDWMLLLTEAGVEKGDWNSNSLYLGLALLYFPTGEPNSFTGFYVGGDAGIASSYQTYRPLGESGMFFFPYIELYFFGYIFPIWGGLYLDLGLGGGYAPVSDVVVIEGHRNKGDFYPLAFLNLGFRW